MSKRVTWLMPIKDGMPYLPETLASIEAQTYKNWEVLVWDNGSTDGTIEELAKWVPDRLPGRVIVGEPSTLGGSLARMVEICETEFCARIDADDLNFPERLERQLEFLSNHPEIAVLGSQIDVIDEKGLPKEYKLPMPIEHDDILHEMLLRSPLAHPSVVFRRAAILQVGNYQNLYFQWNQVNIEDYDLWLRVARQYKIANLAIHLVKYRIHDSSTTILAIRENRLEKAVDDLICDSSQENFGCSESDMRLLRKRSHPFAFRPILQIAKHLQQTQGGTLVDRLNSASFIDSSKQLISPQDIGSLILLGMRHPDRSFLPRELKNTFKYWIKQIPFTERLVGRLKGYKQSQIGQKM